MANPNTALFCDNIGHSNATSDLECCYLNDQNSSVCQRNFGAGSGTFSGGCNLTGNCIADCQSTEVLYSSVAQLSAYGGTGFGPIRRFATCVNIPAMAGYSSHKLLGNLASVIDPHLPQNRTNADLSGVTSAVTECLTQTCRASRNKKACINSCAPVNLLTNSTTPNIEGVNDCLHTLCHGGYDSLPYADADIIGIGVFAAYIMQCIFVVLLCFGLFGFDLYNRPRSRPSTTTEHVPSESKPSQSETEITPANAGNPPKPNDEDPSHEELFENFLVEYHKTQCYFSATLQIASLSYGIFETNMLLIFMLIPLATNGILPVVFAFVLLFRHGKSTMDVTLLTIACWFLSSLVYWILYAHIIPINSQIRSTQKQYRAYEQFMYKLSAIDACGGYSGLAVCPGNNFNLGRADIFAASHNLRVLTPIIWSFSTLCLIAAVFSKYLMWRRSRDDGHAYQAPSEVGEAGEASEDVPQGSNSPISLRSRSGSSIIYWLTTLCFLAGIGMQLSLLSIGTSLNMMNRHYWSFGQVMAITVWSPPLLGWIYDECKKILKEKFNIGDIPK
ncbi:hypothetical protein BU16DRAFT_621842 [Lophium mytilinum]|uniref:Uncharacterized protein n=1 Tax=Lophium mytilinum TaxID=390894 RepID=A0A6A6QGS0_9PEZI|nr:hypothetical protein BU16DRAFT_621842 [Lophium mytilinum]